MTEDLSKGKPTAEAKILVCQCQSTAFEVKRQNKTSVSLECAKCGARTSVKGAVATARVGSKEMSYAVTSTLTGPNAGPAGEGESTGDGSGKDPNVGPNGERYTSFRFRVTDEIAAVVRRALEAIRVQNMRSEKYRAQDWQGHAIEALAADFLAGCPAAVLAVVDAMDEAVAREVAAAEADGKKWTKRKERDLRSKVREQVAVQLGVAESTEYKPEPDPIVEESRQTEKKQEEAREKEKSDPRVEDLGRLHKAVVAAVADYVNEGLCERGEIRVFEKPHDAEKCWDRNGGLLLRVEGDERSRTTTGRTPQLFVWMQEDYSPEIPLCYSEEIDDDIPGAVITVIELLPPDYDKLQDEDQWEKAVIADKREKIR